MIIQTINQYGGQLMHSTQGIKLMNYITEPTVYLIGKQVVVRDELQKFLDKNKVSGWTTDAISAGEELAEIGGRVCYMSFGKPRPGGNKVYLDHIKEVGHYSVFEHATYTLLCEGISRSVSHEFVRHRVGMSPSQLSQRYFDGSETEFCIPPSLAVEVKLAIASSYVQEAALESELEAYVTLGYNPSFDKYLYDYVVENGVSQTIKAIEAGNIWIRSVEAARVDYIELTDYLASLSNNELKGTEKRKFARQAARSVLPNATETKIVMTGNIRAWRHFIELRANRHADPEIRLLAYKVWKKLVKESPNAFGDYKEEQLSDGSFELTTSYGKV